MGQFVCFTMFQALECTDVPFEHKAVLANVTKAKIEKRDGGDMEDKDQREAKKKKDSEDRSSRRAKRGAW